MSNNIKLSSLQFSCLVIYILLSLFNEFGFYILTDISSSDSYLSVIISYFLGLIILFIFVYIFNYREDLSFFDKINYLFGKVIGSGINIILYILYLFIGIGIMYNMGNFILSNYLSVTPILVIFMVIGIMVIYNVYYGIYNISRVATILLFVVLFFNIISNFSLISKFDINNLKPVLGSGINSIRGGFWFSLIDIVPIFLLLMVEKNKILRDNHINKDIFIFYSFGFIIMFLNTIITIGSLGIYLVNIYKYPLYVVLRDIKVLSSIDRMENIIYFKWIISSFIYLSLIIHYISYGINKSSNVFIPTITTFIIIIISFFINDSIFNFFVAKILPIACLFIFIIFIFIWLTIKVRNILGID